MKTAPLTAVTIIKGPVRDWRNASIKGDYVTQIPEKLYFKIGEVASLTNVRPYVLRYWESEFSIIHPKKSLSKQRVYTRSDVEMILEIKKLLYKEKYTLQGAKKKIKEIMAEKARQMDLVFKDEKFQNAIRTVKKELHTIKKILS